jgi:hypothetical protein
MKMTSKQSIHKSVHNIFIDNPIAVYTAKDLLNILNNKSNLLTKKEIITMILTRLHKNNLIIRTLTQLKEGYYYSLDNKRLLNKIYKNHLLPYNFLNKNELLKKIRMEKFDKIKSDSSFNLNKFEKTSFVQKYSKEYFQINKTQEFLALLIGFSICDGHINKRENKCHFFFRRKSDAELFSKDFKKIFNKESLRITKDLNGESYSIRIIKGSALAKLLVKIGVPRGNKVFQHFLIPNWIYYGNDEIKKIFLSTVIGNEGSAPSNNRWRIQFVLSKCEEQVSNLLDLLNQIRTMLYHFGINTSHIQLRKQKGRQFHGRFYIKGKENLHKFYNEFSFLYASEKQEVLEKLISNDLSQKREKRDDLVNTR